MGFFGQTFGHALDRLSFVVGRNSDALRPGGDRPAFLLTSEASAGSRRLAVAVVLLSVAGFFALVPFVQIQLSPVPAFIPVYESALVVNDLITALLLFGQFATLRSRALLVLASGYFFTACMSAAHALTFPGAFSESGLLGAGPQSTAWLYVFWHGGFPVFVIAYSLLLDREGPAEPVSNGSLAPVLMSLGAVIVAALLLIWFATAGHDVLPPVMINGNRYAPGAIYVIGSVWSVIVIALALLWFRRPHSLLDNWLLVTMCAWVFDVALGAVLNSGRFDLGFYAGRIYGLFAATFVLGILLLENGRLYARLVGSLKGEREKMEQLVAANRELEAFSYSISHDLQAPLRSIQAFSSHLLDEQGSELSDKGRKDLGRVVTNARRMQQLIEDLLRFSRLNRQPLARHSVNFAALVGEAIEDTGNRESDPLIEYHVGEIPDCVGDASLLRQVLINLLSNAVKFTRGKNPRIIEIGCRRDDFGDTYYVRDNGAGFDMEYAKRLFGVFQRLHPEHEFEGTGIGLSIVRRIVERHGGHIWAEAKPNAGATFYFTLRR